VDLFQEEKELSFTPSSISHSCRWGEFRRLALESQNEAEADLMALQSGELARIKEWMTDTEDRISRWADAMTSASHHYMYFLLYVRLDSEVGTSPEAVEAQLAQHEELQREFEKREVGDRDDTSYIVALFVDRL